MRITALVITLGALSACSGGGGTGPDAFSVLPNRELQTPANLSELPPPAPGAPNIADPTPRADAVAALGGNPNAVAAPNPALAAYTGRYGTGPATAEPERPPRLLERVFGRTSRPVRGQGIDAAAELDRLGGQGVRTPVAPLPEPAPLPGR